MAKKNPNWKDVLKPYEDEIPKGGVEEVEKLGTRKPKKYKKEDFCSARMNIAKFFCRDVEKINGISKCSVKKWDNTCEKFHIVTNFEVIRIETSKGTSYSPHKNNWTVGTVVKGIRETEKVYPSLTVNEIRHPKAICEPDVLSPQTSFKRLVGLDGDRCDLDVTVL